MTCAEYIAKHIAVLGTNDAFGIPGGVIIKLLYALNENASTNAHLTYNEQTAAFAALGYAQASGRLGVAYATRGPGICNMFTAIAEAYQESLPVLFITAHANRTESRETRFVENQEMDIVNSIRDITKFACNINKIDEVVPGFNKACSIALSGRKGPVLLDFASNLWDKKIDHIGTEIIRHSTEIPDISFILDAINNAKRPIILIGDGLRNKKDKETLIKAFEILKLPVLSSRGSQDLLSGSKYYYGYIGSHGIRYSNFILSKADLIVALGNRMAFPWNSQSFMPILKKAKIIRVDIDDGELNRIIPGEISIKCDATELLFSLGQGKIKPNESWIGTCDRLHEQLDDSDCTEPVARIVDYLAGQDPSSLYVCDVGNNEFWFSRAYEKSKCTGNVLISKSFGTLGSAIGKAIGAYYATGKKVVCVVGDQGFQYNIQELQYITSHNIPVQILLINNHCSRMIADHETNAISGKFLHVNKDTGYTTPNFLAIAKAYNFENKITEIVIDENIRLTPFLPRGQVCQDMEPQLDREQYFELNSL